MIVQIIVKLMSSKSIQNLRFMQLECLFLVSLLQMLSIQHLRSLEQDMLWYYLWSPLLKFHVIFNLFHLHLFRMFLSIK